MGIETAFPTHDMNLLSSMGIGIRMQTVTPFCSMAGISFSTGVTNYFLNSDVKTSEVKNLLAFPMEAGCRLFSAKGLYVEPKAGFTLFSNKAGSDMTFTYALNVGVKAGNYVDLSFGYENAQYSGLALSYAGVTTAYVF